MPTLIIGIHGVGNPKPGEIEKALRETLEYCGVAATVREINWNQLVSHPVMDGNVSGKAVLELAMRLARASLWEWTDPSPPRVNIVRVIDEIRGFGYAGAELGIAALFITLAWIIPLSAILDFFQSSFAQTQTQAITPVLVHSLGLLIGIFLILFASTGIVKSILIRRLFPLLVTFRRLLLLLFRPIILAAYALFVVRWREVWKYWTQLLLILPALMLAFVASFLGEWRLPLGIIATVFALWLITHVLDLVARRGAGSFLKVLLDIFQYTSDPDYRRRIQLFVDERVYEFTRELDTTDVIIVSHSLGSVLSVDSLLHSPQWVGKRITLVTLGSPLRSVFFNFFPGLYFPPSAGSCSSELARRIKNFRWINSYRRLDYVGKRIGLTPNGWLIEVPTKQWMPWHTGYFEDRCAARLVVEKLGVLGYSEEQIPGQRESGLPAAYDPPRHRIWLGNVLGSTCRMLLVLLPILVMGNITVQGRMKTLNSRRERLRETVAKGKQTIASVTHSAELMPVSTTAIVVHHWKFKYKDPQNTSIEWEGNTGETVLPGGSISNDFLVEDDWHFNGDFVRNVNNWDGCNRECTFSSTVVMSIKDPKYFVVPNCLPYFGWWSQTKTIVFHEYVTLLFLGGYGVLSSLFLIPVFEALVGERLFPNFPVEKRNP